MKLYSVIFCLIFLTGCIKEKNNPLLGLWENNREKTLTILKNSNSVPASILHCYESKLCGNSALNFTSEYVHTILKNKRGLVISDDERPYKLISILSDRIKVVYDDEEEFNIYLERNEFYVELEFEGYEYKEFYKRTTVNL